MYYLVECKTNSDQEIICKITGQPSTKVLTIIKIKEE